MLDSPYLHVTDIIERLEHETKLSIRAVHLNVRSAKNKIIVLESLFGQFEIPFNEILLTETWYTSENDAFQLPSYESYCLNRTSSQRGGVCALIEKKMKCELLSNFCVVTKDYEVLSVLTKDTLISVIYRPPDGNIQRLFEFF